MINQQILDYIRSQSAAGKGQEEIKAALRQTGWQDADIEEAFGAFASGHTVAAPEAPGAGLPKASEILKEAWALFRQRMWFYIGITLVPVLAVVVWGLIIGGGAVALQIGGVDFRNPEMGITSVLTIIVSVVILIYIGIWGTVAELVAIRDRAETLTIKESFKRSQRYVLPFLGTSLLVGLAVMGGFILLIVPGVIFAVWFSQSSYVVISENMSGTMAISRSKSYVQGRWGTVFGKMFYIGIVTFFFFIILTLILNLMGLKTTGDNPSALGSGIIQLFNLFWSPVVAIYGYLLYESLKKSR